MSILEQIKGQPADDVINDVKLAAILSVAVPTLRRLARPDAPRVRGDIRQIKHYYVGKFRRWSKTSAEEYMNRSSKEIEHGV
jgi:hypothetical protein